MRSVRVCLMPEGTVERVSELLMDMVVFDRNTQLWRRERLLKLHVVFQAGQIECPV
jgi:hypothetical protein